jgi:hypothetical protein
MKFKKKSIGLSQRKQPNKEKVIIAGEAYEAPEVTTFICNYCNRDLIKLSDSNGNNVSWYCNNCSIPFEPENETIRHKQKLEVPDRNVEPAVSSIQTNMAGEVEIRHTVPVRGGFAELKAKGLKITDYHTTEKE